MVATLGISMDVRGGEETDKERTGERVSQVHIDITGPMHIVLAGEREYVDVVVDEYSHARNIQDRCASSRQSKCSECSG